MSCILLYLDKLQKVFIFLPVFLEALHCCPVHLHIVLVEPQAATLWMYTHMVRISQSNESTHL